MNVADKAVCRLNPDAGFPSIRRQFAAFARRCANIRKGRQKTGSVRIDTFGAMRDEFGGGSSRSDTFGRACVGTWRDRLTDGFRPRVVTAEQDGSSRCGIAC
jgi:hypothetical protein